MQKHRLPIALLIGGLLWPLEAGAQSRAACGPSEAFVASVVAIDGPVQGTTSQGTAFSLGLGTQICSGDTVSVGDAARLELRFIGKDTTVGLAQNSTLRIPKGAGSDTEANATLIDGVLKFLSSVRGFFQIQTKETNAAIDGTEAVIAVSAATGQSLVLVQEGEVTLSPPGSGQVLSLAAGQVGLVGSDAVPRLASKSDVPAAFGGLLATPETASDWAVNYPPILLTSKASDDRARRAAGLLDAGDPDGAEALLRNSGDAASLSLRAVIAVFRNRNAEALDLANRAVATDAEIAASHVALSYALQSNGEVDAAVGAAERAIEAEPGDAFAWARLAELSLLVSNRDDAEDATARSLELRPTALAHAIEGLLALDAHDRVAARIAFDKAIQLDSEAPLPRLGMGLVAIREGRPSDGRGEIETAAALDPRRGSIRNWLGRAYAEEARPEKALSQFELAKERDPEDPSAWLFSAETLFAQNRPVEALREIEGARERAGARAVLRGARGLSEDQAVQGAAIGRTLDILGFEEQAINESIHAAEQDPASPVPHRLLADVLRNREGIEAARTSSLLRHKLLAPPNKAPIDPALAESDLSLLEGSGVTRLSLADFTPFFESNGFGAQASALVGTDDTFSDTISLNALHDGFSIGAAQFHYETDGFRLNNDVNHDLVMFELKGEVIPGLTLFASYSHRDSSFGDRLLEFDLVSEGPPDANIDEEEDEVNLGFHYEIDGNNDIIGVFRLVQNDSLTTFNLPPIIFSSVSDFEEEARGLQGQHIGRYGPYTSQIGASFYTTDDRQITNTVLFFPPGIFIPVLSDDTDQSTHGTVYGYVTRAFGPVGPLAGAEVTVGASYDDFESGPLGNAQRKRFNGKAGLRLSLTEDIVLRGAYTRTITPFESMNQVIEPVTVAGFVQYFDQQPGSSVTQAAGALDVKVAPGAWFGVEGAYRQVDFLFGDGTIRSDETEIRAYLNKTFGDYVAGSLDVEHLIARSDFDPDLNEFEATEATASLNAFHPSGLFASVTGGWVWHNFTDNAGFANIETGNDNFPLLNAALGFRLPEQRGIISLEVQNLVDASFGFEDRPLVALSNPTGAPRFARDLTLLGRITLNF